MKFPNILSLSERKVKAAMDFLINNGRFELRSTASQPMLLGYSLEKRLVPRHHVWSIMKMYRLKTDYRFLSLCVWSEKTFLEKCIVPFEKDVPGLAEAYAAACSGKVPH